MQKISFLLLASLTYPPSPRNSSSLTPPETPSNPPPPLSLSALYSLLFSEALVFFILFDGAGFSSFSAVEGESQRRGLGDIAEGYVASILVHLSPTDIYRLARLSQSFRGAARADFSGLDGEEFRWDLHVNFCQGVVNYWDPEILEVHSSRGVQMQMEVKK